jgi:2-desacetyl-2-hydroxyethyl bacteriochlorophyllide A dehydrogenase
VSLKPEALLLTGVKTLEFTPLELKPLGPGDVRIETLYSGISAGTELGIYRGVSPYLHRQWDARLRVYRESGTPSWTFPIDHLGYEEVGRIVEVGSAVTQVAIGDHVFGTWHHVTHATMNEADALARRLPAGADPRIGIYSHIGAVALNGVHDAHIRMGDLVVVFGLGVPGQIVCQMARASGATVIGVDPVAGRRKMAEKLGADRTLDPTAGSVAERIKDETAGRGADVCIEVSGNAVALAEAIRTVAYSSRVVAMGFISGEARGLFLGDEFHHNRVEVVSSQISGVAPEASHRWTRLRLWQSAIRLQHEGRIDLVPLITDVVPFAEAPAMFARLDAGDPAILQAVLSFEAAA